MKDIIRKLWRQGLAPIQIAERLNTQGFVAREGKWTAWIVRDVLINIGEIPELVRRQV
jgi:hypothetical protein